MVAFTLFHVALSLVGIVSGFVLVAGLVRGKYLPGWNVAFLTTNILTDVTGFGFPTDKFLPSHAFAILSLMLLAAAMYAAYSRKRAGYWRPTFVITTTAALYLNFFVLVVQAFLKVPALRELAPTQTEPPFAIAQGITLLGFLVLGVAAVYGSKPMTRVAVAR
jgi:hypothetical protein